MAGFENRSGLFSNLSSALSWRCQGQGEQHQKRESLRAPPPSPEVEKGVRGALATPGRPGFHKIAAQFGVATGTVQRIAHG